MSNENWTMIASLSAAISALVAIAYTIVTYKLLKANMLVVDKSNKLAEFQVYDKLSEKIVSEDAKTVLNKIVDDVNVDFNNIDFTNKVKYVLLNPIEDCAKYFNDKLITLESINTGFGFHILKIGKSDKVIDFIIQQRKHLGNEVFSGFEQLYNEIRAKKLTDEERKGYPEINKRLEVKPETN